MFLLNKSIPNHFILECVILMLLSKLPYNSKTLFLYGSFLLLICVWINIINLMAKFDAKMKLNIGNLFMLLFTVIIVYALVYYSIYNNDKNSFSGPINLESDINEKDGYADIFSNLFDMIYFTMSTIATVGYGDIIPRSKPARFVVMTEFIIGIILLSVLIGKTK